MKELTSDGPSDLIDYNEKPGPTQKPQTLEPAKKTRQLNGRVHGPNKEHNRDYGYQDIGDPDYSSKKTRQLNGLVHGPTKEQNRDYGYPDRGDPDYSAKKTRQLIAPVHKPTKELNGDWWCADIGDPNYTAKKPSDFGATNIEKQMNGLKARLKQKPQLTTVTIVYLKSHMGHAKTKMNQFIFREFAKGPENLNFHAICCNSKG